MPVRIIEFNEQGKRFNEWLVMPNKVEFRIDYKDNAERTSEIKRMLKDWNFPLDTPIEPGRVEEYTKPDSRDNHRSEMMPESFYDAEDAEGHHNLNRPDVP